MAHLPVRSVRPHPLFGAERTRVVVDRRRRIVDCEVCSEGRVPLRNWLVGMTDPFWVVRGPLSRLAPGARSSTGELDSRSRGREGRPSGGFVDGEAEVSSDSSAVRLRSRHRELA